MDTLSSVEAMELKQQQQQHQNGTSLIFNSEVVSLYFLTVPKCVFALLFSLLKNLILPLLTLLTF